jgi:predicted SAM-dependent methyltransferase
VTLPRLLSLILVGSLFFAGTLFGLRTFEKEEPTPVLVAAKDPCHRSKPSALATKYLENLHGVEIGASTQNSFGLKRAINVDFSDTPGDYWQSKDCAPAIVNIVANGDNLPFNDGTLDYVLSSHVMEHFFDPIKALKEWHRVIRPGGYIFIIAPHMERTFDKHREPTAVAELVDRNTGKVRISNYARPLNQKALEKFGMEKLGEFYQVKPHILVRNRAATRLEEGWAYYATDDHHHWSAWRTADFVELVKSLNYEIVEIQDTDDKVGNGFTVVIKR